jgi:hypothetical protein
MFMNNKQDGVAKSSYQAELYAKNHVGDYLYYARGTHASMGFPLETSVMQQDIGARIREIQKI